MITTVEAMTKLYRLTSVIDDWPHRGARHNNVKVTWFVCERDYDPGFDYATLLDRPLPSDDDPYAQGLVDERFTRYEADQLAEYLRTAHDTDVEIAEVSVPINVGYLDSEGRWITYMPVGAIPVGGDCDFYTLSKHDDYSLPFKAWGYYRIDFEDRITREETENMRQFPGDAATVVSASHTPGCDGNVVVEAIDGYVEMRGRGADELCGPSDDGDSTPNSGAVVRFSASEARELAGLLLAAADAICR
jgi:hypothetical protein